MDYFNHFIQQVPQNQPIYFQISIEIEKKLININVRDINGGFNISFLSTQNLIK